MSKERESLPSFHVGGCICPRFQDIAPNLIADLTCPIHGINGTDPGDKLVGEGRRDVIGGDLIEKVRRAIEAAKYDDAVIVAQERRGVLRLAAQHDRAADRHRVLIPYRHHPGRVRPLELVLAYWRDTRPDWTVTLATQGEPGPFNKARALNRAAALAGEDELLVIADADSLVPPLQIQMAIDRQAVGPVSCFTEYRRLSRQDTAALSSWRKAFGLAPEWQMDCSGSTGCLVIHASAWRRLGGMDEGFPIPLYEDLAFWTHAAAVYGKLPRVAGPLVHLWHPRDEGRWPDLEAVCRQRYERYQAAAGDEQAILRVKAST